MVGDNTLATGPIESSTNAIMLTVILPDGSRREFSAVTTAYDVAAQIGPGLAKAAIVAEVAGALCDLHSPLPDSGEVRLRLLTNRDAEALAVMRHSAAHVMAQAVMRLYEGVSLAFGPTTATGFYYDFHLEHPLSEEDFPKIEAEMAKIVAADEKFERHRHAARATHWASARKWGRPSRSSIFRPAWPIRQSLSFYRQGEFIDLCRGQHIPSTRHIGKAFKLLSVAGAYWKGDASRQQLQRLYATAFFDKDRARRLSHPVGRSQTPRPPRARQAARTVHRESACRLGADPVAAQGGRHPPDARRVSPRGVAASAATKPVYTPNIGRVELYQISGHFPYYSDSQFKPIDMAGRRALSA